MSEQQDEKAIFKEIDELITTMEDNLGKKAKFVRLFEERADENAMKIWKECFKEAYGAKTNNDQV